MKKSGFGTGHRSCDFYSNSWALVIGINKYDDPKIKPLKYAENDAEALAALLPDLGFPKSNIRLLLGSKHKITDSVINSILVDDFNPKMQRDDRLLFYLAGHGVTYEVNKTYQGYILMKNSKIYGPFPSADNPYLTKMPGSSLGMEESLMMISKLPAKHKLLLLDSCFSGFMTEARSSAEPSIFSSKKLYLWSKEPVTQIITAGSSGQEAIENGSYKHGVFTWYLLEALKGAADTRNDGIISFDDLMAYISGRVEQELSTSQVPQAGSYKRGAGKFFFIYGDTVTEKGKTGVVLPHHDDILGKSVSDTEQARPSPMGTQGVVRKYEKGSIYAITKLNDDVSDNLSQKNERYKPIRLESSALEAHYENLGGTASRLGFPIAQLVTGVESIQDGVVNGGEFQAFEGGVIYTSQLYGAQTLWTGEIATRFQESQLNTIPTNGSVGGVFGFPAGKMMTVSLSSGSSVIIQRFGLGLMVEKEGRVISILGDFYRLYRSIDEWNGPLGLPIEDESQYISPVSGVSSRRQTFEKGVIILNEESRRCLAVSKDLFREWQKSPHKYGFPQSSPYVINNVSKQIFEGGIISVPEALRQEDDLGLHRDIPKPESNRPFFLSEGRREELETLARNVSKHISASLTIELGREIDVRFSSLGVFSPEDANAFDSSYQTYYMHLSKSGIIFLAASRTILDLIVELYIAQGPSSNSQKVFADRENDSVGFLARVIMKEFAAKYPEEDIGFPTVQEEVLDFKPSQSFFFDSKNIVFAFQLRISGNEGILKLVLPEKYI